jgi:integrase
MPDSVATLTIPARETKNGREHVVPLPSLISGVIAAVPRLQGVDFLFPGGRSRKTGKITGIAGWSKFWPRLLKIAGEYGFAGHLKIHDLRKSARSHWRRLGVQVDVCERMLNHSDPNVLIDIYDLNKWLPEKIEAMDKWVAAIEQALGKPPAAEVVAMHRIHAAKKARRVRS